MRPHFIDNTDPDGIERRAGRDRRRSQAHPDRGGVQERGYQETRNGMLEAKAAYENGLGLDFEDYAVAVTGEGSALEQDRT